MDWNFNILDEEERELIFSLALIPYAFYSIPQLSAFFLIDEKEQISFFDKIHDLALKGFLENKKGAYSLDRNLSEYINKNINPGIEECPRIVNYFMDQLEISYKDFENDFLPLYDLITIVVQRINKNNLHIAQLCYLLTSNLIRHKRYNEALQYNDLSLEISEKIDNQHPLVALFYRDRAYIHKKMGNPEKSILYGLKDIEILEHHEGKYDDLLPDSYFALSKTYEGIRNFEKAVEYSLKAIQYEQKRTMHKTHNLSHLYQNLAYYYVKLNNLHHASLFINKAVESFNIDKSKSDNEYLQLIRDQKRFNSLYDIELIIRKLKYPILIFVVLCLMIFVWIFYQMFF